MTSAHPCPISSRPSSSAMDQSNGNVVSQLQHQTAPLIFRYGGHWTAPCRGTQKLGHGKSTTAIPPILPKSFGYMSCISGLPTTSNRGAYHGQCGKYCTKGQKPWLQTNCALQCCSSQCSGKMNKHRINIQHYYGPWKRHYDTHMIYENPRGVWPISGTPRLQIPGQFLGLQDLLRFQIPDSRFQTPDSKMHEFLGVQGFRFQTLDCYYGFLG